MTTGLPTRRATFSLKDKDNHKTLELHILYPFDYQESDKFISGIFLRWKRPVSTTSPTKKDES
jgi:hypothetical protein